jgi:hypothetical protein
MYLPPSYPTAVTHFLKYGVISVWFKYTTIYNRGTKVLLCICTLLTCYSIEMTTELVRLQGMLMEDFVDKVAG